MRTTRDARRFLPQQVLFSSTSDCNLDCGHCSVRRERRRLPPAVAVRFLKSCRRLGIERVGFTGGEPFLDPEFLIAVSAAAVKYGFLFDRIATNAAWFKTPAQLRRTLEKLRDSGYDGTFGISVDAFHASDPADVALFLETAAEIWDRPDIAQIVAVKGARDRLTAGLLQSLARRLKAKIITRNGRRFIKNESLLLPIATIELVPVGKAEGLVASWGRKWFREDYCQGPGQIFFVLPDGNVKPCCGYATDADRLTIGNIYKDSAGQILKAAGRNKFVTAVFEQGLSRIRERLAADGIRFPGKTSIPCAFCHYVLTDVPSKTMNKCLAALSS